jgi:hypothetical protein
MDQENSIISDKVNNNQSTEYFNTRSLLKGVMRIAGIFLALFILKVLILYFLGVDILHAPVYNSKDVRALLESLLILFVLNVALRLFLVPTKRRIVISVVVGIVFCSWLFVAYRGDVPVVVEFTLLMTSALLVVLLLRTLWSKEYSLVQAVNKYFALFVVIGVIVETLFYVRSFFFQPSLMKEHPLYFLPVLIATLVISGTVSWVRVRYGFWWGVTLNMLMSLAGFLYFWQLYAR